MTTPESTEPSAAAHIRDALIEAIAPVFARWVQDEGPDYDPVPDMADAALATIAPPTPGRVCLTWETACDMASWEDHFDMMDVERFREYISGPLKAAIAAAERAANGEA